MSERSSVKSFRKAIIIIMVLLSPNFVQASAYYAINLLYGDVDTGTSDNGLGLGLAAGYGFNDYLGLELQAGGYDDYDYLALVFKPRLKLDEAKWNYIYAVVGSASMQYNKGNNSDSGSVAGVGYSSCMKSDTICLNFEVKSAKGDDTDVNEMGVGMAVRFK